MKTTHFTYELFGGPGIVSTTYATPCGAYSPRHDYSGRIHEVTCKKCLKKMGYKVEEAA